MSNRTQRIIAIVLGVICIIMMTLVVIKYKKAAQPAEITFGPLSLPTPTTEVDLP